jgi:hypothetical protein
MIELLFVTCLVASPDACQERSILYQQDVSLMGCMMIAQPELAKWAEAHPKDQIARWSCRQAGAGADDA